MPHRSVTGVCAVSGFYVRSFLGVESIDVRVKMVRSHIGSDAHGYFVVLELFIPESYDGLKIDRSKVVRVDVCEGSFVGELRED